MPPIAKRGAASFLCENAVFKHKKRGCAKARLRCFVTGVVEGTRTLGLLGHNQAL